MVALFGYIFFVTAGNLQKNAPFGDLRLVLLEIFSRKRFPRESHIITHVFQLDLQVL